MGFAAREMGQLFPESPQIDPAMTDLVRETGISPDKTPFVDDGTRNAIRASPVASGGEGATCAEFGFLSAPKGFLGARSVFLVAEFALRTRN